jgi:hypothetical protein
MSNHESASINNNEITISPLKKRQQSELPKNMTAKSSTRGSPNGGT